MTMPILQIIMVISILLQFASALVALNLIIKSGFFIPWVTISAAVLLMGIRRLTSFLSMAMRNDFPSHQISPELIALGISGLMFTGLLFLSPAFKSLRKSHNTELKNKELLIRETHHHVKNDLQILQNLVQLQETNAKNQNEKLILRDLLTRIQTFSILHQQLYQGQFSNSSEYFRTLISNIQEIYREINVTYQIVLPQTIRLNQTNLLYCGLILNEVLTNSYKYAFKDILDPGIWISVSESNSSIQFEIRDNGIGIPRNILKTRHSSYGLEMIRSICGSPGWSYKLETNKGTKISFVCPVEG